MAITLPVCMEEMKNSAQTFFIELYTIELRTGAIYLAAADEDIVFNGQKYIAVPIQRESVTRSMDNITDSCNLTISDVDYGMLAYVCNGFDFRGSMATVIRIQYPESLSDPKIFEWIYAGSIDEPAFSDGTFSCKLQTVFPQIDCPNRSYQLACNSDFGDDECGYNIKEYIADVEGAENNKVTINKSFTSNYWKNGVITIEGESRIIEQSDGTTLTLNVNFAQENIVGRLAFLRQGCDKSQERCKFYGNTMHYSGFPAIPFESVYR